MGILSIVDMHQDGISRYLNNGCGDGFPLWVIPARYTNLINRPDNAYACRTWKYSLLLDPALAGTWLAFFSNENGVRDSFLKVWEILAGITQKSLPATGADVDMLCMS
jgi:endoglycosylceramidase